MSVYTCLQNEPSHVCESVFFAEFERKYHNLLKTKTGKWDLKILLFNYWNDFVL